MPIEIIVRIIEETIARFGDGAPYDQYREVAGELYPTEMHAMNSSFARHGFVRCLKQGMRYTFNEGEQNPSGPVVQLDLLPGLAAPAYINIGTFQTPRPRRFSDCTVADLDVAIHTREVVSHRQGARLEDLRQKRAWLQAHAYSDQEPIAEVIARLVGAPTVGGTPLHP